MTTEPRPAETGHSTQETYADSERRTWESLEYQQRLAAAAFVIRAICAHANEGCTFRHLIYDRLGFDPDAYSALHMAGGMTISNEFVLGGDVSEEDDAHAALVEKWANSVMPAPSKERSAALSAAWRFRDVLSALAKQDEIRRRMQAELDAALGARP